MNSFFFIHFCRCGKWYCLIRTFLPDYVIKLQSTSHLNITSFLRFLKSGTMKDRRRGQYFLIVCTMLLRYLHCFLAANYFLRKLQCFRQPWNISFSKTKFTNILGFIFPQNHLFHKILLSNREVISSLWLPYLSSWFSGFDASIF